MQREQRLLRARPSDDNGYAAFFLLRGNSAVLILYRRSSQEAAQAYESCLFHDAHAQHEYAVFHAAIYIIDNYIVPLFYEVIDAVRVFPSQDSLDYITASPATRYT